MNEVVEIRRYPVKSMAGESVESAAVDARGLVGDRWFAVTDSDGRLASGKDSRRFRRRDAVFAHAAQIVDGEVLVTGPRGVWPVGDPELDRALSEQMGDEVHVLPESGTPHQDAGQVSLVGTASLDWCREHLEVDGDRRRIRPNIVVRTSEPFVEETWAGARLQIGNVVLTVVERIERCRMVDVAQEGLDAQPGWLKALGRVRDLSLGMYADVARAGSITRGDPVLVLSVKDFLSD